MRTYLPAIVVTLVLAAVAAGVMQRWMASANLSVSTREPGADGTGGAPSGPAVDLRGRLVRSGVTAPEMKGEWPRFRGPDGNNISPEDVKLSRAWSAGGPPRLWSLPMGEGYAGAAVRNGRVYVLDYDGKAGDVLRCLSLEDGKEIWQRSYAVEVKRNHGMSRTVPTVTDKYVVTLGPKCHVVCADAITGEFVWGIDLVAEHRTKVPPWYAGQCPLVDGDRVILAPGGECLLMAVELATGKVVWKTPNPGRWDMTHTSVVPMTIGGKKTYVYSASKGVVGVSAEDGKLLWQTGAWKVNIAAVASPLVLGEDRLFLCGGYGAGCMMLKLKQDGGKIAPEVLWARPPEIFGSEQQTPILYKDHIFGVTPKVGHLVCMDLDGNVVWSSGNETNFGIGPYMIADGMIFVMNDKGVLTIAEADPSGYKPLAQATVIEKAHESWGPMALVGGRLIVRELERMVCLNVKEP